MDWIRFLLTLPLSLTPAHLAIMSCVTSDLFLIIVPFSSKSRQNMIHGQSCSGFHRDGCMPSRLQLCSSLALGQRPLWVAIQGAWTGRSTRGMGRYWRLPWPGRIPQCPAAKQPSCRSKKSNAVCGLSLALSCRLSISFIKGICCLVKYILNFLGAVFTFWKLKGNGIVKCCPVSAPEPQCATVQHSPPA